MHISTEKRVKECELNLTPMIDVVFLLIAFFMFVTEITRQDAVEDLKLPDVRQAALDDEPEPDRLILNITQSGIVVVGGHKYDLSKTKGAAAVKRLLRVEARLSPRTPTGLVKRLVLVRADKRARFRHIHKIIGMCVDPSVGIWRLAFGTLPFQSAEQKAAAAKKTGS